MRKNKRKRASLPPLALYGDLPAEKVRQAAADRKTEAGAFPLAREARIDLAEWLKDFANVFRTNADACVGNLEGYDG